MGIPGDMHLKRPWSELIAELKDEFRMWEVREYQLPVIAVVESKGYVEVSYVPPSGKTYIPIRCDNWKAGYFHNWKERNLYAIVSSIRAARLADQCGIGNVLAQATRHFLPAGPAFKRDPHDVLEARPGASKEVLLAAFRALAKKRHPDNGGTNAAMAELNEAAAALGLI